MKLIFTFVCSLLSMVSISQVTWNFGTVAGTAVATSGSIPNVTVSTVTQGNNNGTTTMLNSTSASAGYTGASGNFNANASAKPDQSQNINNTYFEFTLTPAAGFRVIISKIAFGMRATASGPTGYILTKSTNSFGAAFGAGGIDNNGTWILDEWETTQTGNANTPFTIRIYATGASGSTGTSNWKIDDLSVTASAEAAMPLTLLDFYAKAETTSLLKWITADEINVKEFLLERGESVSQFSTVAIIKAKGNTKNDYTYADLTARGKQFYRLKMVDLDGSFTYSKIISTETKETTDIYKVAGLPVLRTNERKKQIIIYDLSGRKILCALTSDRDIKITALAKGQYYYVEVNENNVRGKIKFFND
jgi:hypothetical protein